MVGQQLLVASDDLTARDAARPSAPSAERRRPAWRRFVRRAAVTTGAATAIAYVKPSLRALGVPRAQATISPHVLPFPSTSAPKSQRGRSFDYWRNATSAWWGYAPSQAVRSVFRLPDGLAAHADETLLQALHYGGGDAPTGSAQVLLREAVAALLNAAHPGVSYPLTTSLIVGQVSAALASGDRNAIMSLAGIYADVHDYEGVCP